LGWTATIDVLAWMAVASVLETAAHPEPTTPRVRIIGATLPTVIHLTMLGFDVLPELPFNNHSEINAVSSPVAKAMGEDRLAPEGASQERESQPAEPFHATPPPNRRR
jgi:hypothetical protein